MSDAHANGTVTRDIPAIGATPDGDTNFGEQLALLLHRLARSTGGVGFVYETLHELAARHELTDAILTIDVPSLGRQAFRLGRRPLDAELGRALAAPGLVTEPDVVPASIRSIVEDAAQIAVSLQVAQASSIRDSLSGLLSRRGFNEALRTVAAQSSRYGWPFTLVLLSLGAREALADPDSEEQAVRRAGRALARALRSGDIGTRIDGTTFAAVLPNAGAEAINALLERIAGELPSVALAELSLGAANAPRESVDPVELFRLASARMSEERTSAP
jgi:GGDEF domain-containing protein